MVRISLRFSSFRSFACFFSVPTTVPSCVSTMRLESSEGDRDASGSEGRKGGAWRKKTAVLTSSLVAESVIPANGVSSVLLFAASALFFS